MYFKTKQVNASLKYSLNVFVSFLISLSQRNVLFYLLSCSLLQLLTIPRIFHVTISSNKFLFAVMIFGFTHYHVKRVCVCSVFLASARFRTVDKLNSSCILTQIQIIIQFVNYGFELLFNFHSGPTQTKHSKWKLDWCPIWVRRWYLCRTVLKRTSHPIK